VDYPASGVVLPRWKREGEEAVKKRRGKKGRKNKKRKKEKRDLRCTAPELAVLQNFLDLRNRQPFREETGEEKLRKKRRGGGEKRKGKGKKGKKRK